ncbi:MAG: cytochrome P450 [Polyangia bacterium]
MIPLSTPTSRPSEALRDGPAMPLARPLPTPPGPRGQPVLGDLLRIHQQGLLPFFRDVHQRFGELVRVRLGPLPAYLVVAPALVEQVLLGSREGYQKGRAFDSMRLLIGDGLLTSEGALWQRQRRLLQPFFTRAAVAGYVEAMGAAVADRLARWQQRSDRGDAEQPVQLTTEMMSLAMDVIGRCLFGIKLASEAAQVGDAIYDCLLFTSRRTRQLAPPPLWVPTPANRAFVRSRRLVTDFILSRIAARAAACGTSSEQAGLLDALTQARDSGSGDGMSQKQLVDEILTFFLAGHETTAVGLTWTLHLVSRHPEVEARLHEEVDRVLAGQPPTAHDLEALVYTRQVIDEALRLYPPLWIYPRTAAREQPLGGFVVPAGAMMLIAPYLTHRLPGLWPDPERFDPERFRPEHVAARPRHAYLPFGFGPRACIGQHFALQEMVLAVAAIAQRFSVRAPAGPEVAVALDAESTLRPGGPMTVCLRRRACS